MVKYYLIYADVYLNGEILHKRKYSGYTLRDERDAAPYAHSINWDTIHNQTFDDVHTAGLSIWNLKKGTKVEFWGDYWEKIHRPLKQWKGDKLNITINYYFEEKQVSLNEILEYSNAEMAIQYLKDRGLSICPR